MLVADQEEMEDSDTTDQSFDPSPPVSACCSTNAGNVSLNSVTAESSGHTKLVLSHKGLVDETNPPTFLSQTVPMRLEVTADNLTFKDHSYLNLAQKKNASRDLVPLCLEGNCAYNRRHQEIMTKKPSKRDTDHMYNARKADTVDKTLTRKVNKRDIGHLYNMRKATTLDENLTKKPNNRDTDHMYNTTKAGSGDEALTKKINQDTDPAHLEEIPLRKLNNRDTDHMYNMRKAKTVIETLSHEVLDSVSCILNDASAEKNATSDCTTVDKRVVDKDHMYQHNVRKPRNKLENRGTVLTSQHQFPSSLDTAKAKKKKKRRRQISTKATDTGLTHQSSLNQKTLAGADGTVQPNKLTRNGSSTGTYPVKLKGKNVQAFECDQMVCSMECDPVACSLIEHGYTSVEIEGSAVLDSDSILPTSTSTAATKLSSPVHSDNDSDHTYEDDSRRMSVFHADHMYVHADYLDGDILDQGKGHVTTDCFSSEGYRQEHSYANSEEIRYDACKNCSELVQQLIGTIHQQRNHIDDLRKQLQAANVKNKQLSLMFTGQLENVN